MIRLVGYLPVTMGHAANGRPIRMHVRVERYTRPRRSRLWQAALITLGLLLASLVRGGPSPIPNPSQNEMSR